MDTQQIEIDGMEDKLPEDIQSLLDELRAAKNIKIDSIGKEVARKRDDAIKFRKQSGIEDVWNEDLEFYLGVDDGNRDQISWQKSPSTGGGISKTPSASTTRCTSFFNITRQFVESASARMGDILLPAGDWNFSVKATPVQDDESAAGGQPQVPQVPGAPTAPIDPMAPVDPTMPGVPAAPPAPSPEKTSPRQLEAEKKAEKGETKIQDWLVESSYHTEVRKVIEDAAKLGTGILKGPYPDKYTVRKALETQGRTSLEITTAVGPKSRSVECWNLFPDPACGDDIHKGSYILERDFLNAKQLKDLKGLKGYLSEQIDLVLDEGPYKKNYDDGRRLHQQDTADSEEYEVWYYYGLVDVSDLSAMNVKTVGKNSTKEMLPAIVTMVNDTPIKAFVNPLESGEFPYDLMPWQRNPGSPWGTGIARQGRTPQEMLNSAARALMDNAGLSSGPMMVIRQNAVVPANGRWELTARKIWWATEQGDFKKMEDAFLAVNIPMIQQELTAIIQLAYKMMEDATGIFFIMQGQQGTAPDTVGGMELLHKNASAILRRLARIFDERVTEPHIKRYYEYLLLHGPEDCKGDMKIQAIGSTSLVEREIQAMEAVMLLQLAANPIYELDPAKAMIEVLKSKRMIPDKWVMDDAKKAEMAKKVPMVPAIEVQKIKSADVDKQIAHEKDIAIAGQTIQKHKIDVDRSHENIYAETKAQEVQTNAEMRIRELMVKRELAMLQYATQEKISLDQIKEKLASNSMKLRVQKQMAGVGQVMTPVVEPPGRAEEGHAFEQ